MLSWLYLFSAILFTRAVEWHYFGDHGTSHWYEDYPICSQDRQSPIDFPQVEDMHYDSQLVPFRFTGFDDVSSYGLTLVNNGHTAVIKVTSGELFVEGGGLPGRFRTAQFHFHWGRSDSGGSEHTLNGRRYPLELHIVNYNEKYGDLSNAASKERDGLAVLGFWFEVSTKDNNALLPLIEQLSHVKTQGSSVVLSGVNLGQLLPIHDDYIESHYFRYSGSLTTPPCFQSVIWTVFHHPVPISEQQLQMFRALHEDQQPDSEHYLINNFRPVQPLNGRVISRNFQPQSKDTTVDTPSVTTTKPKRDLKINFRMLKLWSKHYQI